MHTYDFLMIAVIIGCTVFGAWKGVVWQLASLASLVLSYLVALQFSDQLAPYIGAEKPWNRAVAMLILYVGTAALIWLGFRFVAKVIDRIKLKEFDRQLGAIFGAAKGVLLCLVITFFAVSLSATAQEVVPKSKSGKYMARFLDHAHPHIPHAVHEVLHPYFERLRRGVDPNAPHDPHHDEHAPERPGQIAGQGHRPGTRSTSHQPGEPGHGGPGFGGPGFGQQILEGAIEGVRDKVLGGDSKAGTPEPPPGSDGPGLEDLFKFLDPAAPGNQGPQPPPGRASRPGDRRT